MLDLVADPRMERMRAEIEQSGETLLEPGELNLLYRGEISDDHRWNMIAEIAINEGWSFTFSPDDSVRFAKL
jgi:hypothetical protein